MANLIAKSACAGLLPLSSGKLRLTEAAPTKITSIAPLNGKQKATSDALTKALGLALPAPNRTTTTGTAQLIWTGPGQYFLLAKPAPVLKDLATTTDQTDAWATVRLTGPNAGEVLARLTPIDLRAHSFKPGHAARAPLGHMMSIITRRPDGFQIMVFRSTAQTMVHELHEAMQSVTAELALTD